MHRRYGLKGPLGRIVNDHYWFLIVEVKYDKIDVKELIINVINITLNYRWSDLKTLQYARLLAIQCCTIHIMPSSTKSMWEGQYDS